MSERQWCAGIAAAFVGFVCMVFSAQAQPAGLVANQSYQIMQAGLTDANHTRADGLRSSAIDAMNDAGLVIGSTERWSGSAFAGRTAWVFNADTGVTTAIGYPGPFTISTSFPRADNSRAIALDPAGHVLGWSDYQAATGSGHTAWIYDATTASIRAFGLGGAEHTRSTGYTFSEPVAMNAAQQAVGYSTRYLGSSFSTFGQSAWYFNPTSNTTTLIGLTDASYTRSDDGYKFNAPIGISGNGFVAGYAYRFVPPQTPASTGSARAAWSYSTATNTTTRTGFTNAAHTAPDGTQYSMPVAINANGLTLGMSNQYRGSSNASGFSGWLYNPVNNTTTRVGFFGAGYVTSTGDSFTTPNFLSNAGQAVGVSVAIDASDGPASRDGWFYDSASGQTRSMGLTDAAHTQYGFYHEAEVLGLSASNRAVGKSLRWDANSISRGFSTWSYDFADNQTTKIGLYDAMHTKNEGSQFSRFEAMNANGDVAGYSERYNGGSTFLGRSGWFYDADLEQMFPLIFSTSGNQASTTTFGISDDGTVLGSYMKYGAGGGTRAFAWSVAAGFTDLGDWVDGGLAGNGWSSIGGAFFMNDAGQIYGTGKRTGNPGVDAFVLDPVPEPAVGLVTLILLGGWSLRARPCRAPRCAPG